MLEAHPSDEGDWTPPDARLVYVYTAPGAKLSRWAPVLTVLSFVAFVLFMYGHDLVAWIAAGAFAVSLSVRVGMTLRHQRG